MFLFRCIFFSTVITKCIFTKIKTKILKHLIIKLEKNEKKAKQRILNRNQLFFTFLRKID